MERWLANKYHLRRRLARADFSQTIVSGSRKSGVSTVERFGEEASQIDVLGPPSSNTAIPTFWRLPADRACLAAIHQIRTCAPFAHTFWKGMSASTLFSKGSCFEHT